jgi:glycosyltransferase involved in cell wall biosynthesis
MPRLTLCMIVRDEEDLLAGCLSSVRGAVDEIVVVDTGSRDRTKRIALDAGARVYDFPWCDDFAAARNETLKHAHGHWVLQLDADERLGPGAVRALRSAVAGAKFDCGMLRLHDASRLDALAPDVIAGRDRCAEVQLVPRLLRRTDGLSYVDSIHENVMPWLRRRGSRIAGVDADIVHFGATKAVVDAKGKVERNLRLLRARIARDPSDVMAAGYLAHDCMRAGAMDEAYEVAARGWQHARAASAMRLSIHRVATAYAHLLIGRRQFEEAREVAKLARELDGENPDFSFFEGYSLESQALAATHPNERSRLLETARVHYGECLGFGTVVFAQSFVVGARGWYGQTRLGTVELLLGRQAEALRAFESALASKPAERAPRLGKAEATLDLGQPLAALAQIEPLLDSGPAGWILAAAAARSCGRMDDARLFVRQARSLLPNGLLAPHRRDRLRELVSDAAKPTAGPALGVGHP